MSSGGRWIREAPYHQHCGSQSPVDHSVQTWAHTRKMTISSCPVVGMRGSDASFEGPDVGAGQGSPRRWLLEKHCLRDQAQSPSSTCSLGERGWRVESGGLRQTFQVLETCVWLVRPHSLAQLFKNKLKTSKASTGGCGAALVPDPSN